MLYYAPVIPFSSVTPTTCIGMPKNYISWVNSIIPIHLKYIIQTTIQPSLLAIKLSNTLENSSVIRYNTISTRISTGIRGSNC